jgi:hypothetical protein
LVPGGFVHVSVVAEAELAPRNAVRAMAATAARPSIFRYFMLFSLSQRVRRRVVLRTAMF